MDAIVMNGEFGGMPLEELLNKVVDIARQAGNAILEVYDRKEKLIVDSKDDLSPVTEADLAAHDVINRALLPLLEGTPILSEEAVVPDFEVRSQWNRYWIVDPLDGTREFIEGNDEFTVNIALVVESEPVLGVVYVPVNGTVYTGLKGVGAFKIDSEGKKKICTRDVVQQLNKEPVVIVASRRHGCKPVEQVLNNLKKQDNAVELLNIGSSLKFCLIAEGVADFYPRFGPTSEWDTAAAQAVVEAAGGLVVDRSMRPLRYNTKRELLNPDFFVIGDKAFYWFELLVNH